MKFLFLLIFVTACATTKPERVFWEGNKVCFQNAEKTLCTIADDPNDPVHLVEGVEREVEEPKVVKHCLAWKCTK